MFDSLTRAAAVFVLTGALWIAGPVATAAQQPAPAAPVTDLSQDELETFARAYIEVMEIAEQTEVALSQVQDPARAQQIQVDAQEQMAEVLDEHDLDPDRYRRIAMTLNEDLELRQRFMDVMERLQRGGGGG